MCLLKYWIAELQVVRTPLHALGKMCAVHMA